MEGIARDYTPDIVVKPANSDEVVEIVKAANELVEMEWNHKISRCCGAGGGLKVGRPSDSVGIASRRVQEAKETGASVLVTACPFCLRNLTDGARLIGSDIEVRTVESLVSELVKVSARRVPKK